LATALPTAPPGPTSESFDHGNAHTPYLETSGARSGARKQIGTLMVLADETNGFCICNMNDPKPGLRKIDGAMSDYYLLGYVSTNPDPLHMQRKIEIRVQRADVKEIQYLKEYTLPRPRRR
jgi:hypothetical protein